MSSSRTDASELQVIQRRLSESMQSIQKKEAEVQGILDMMDSLPSIGQHLMMRSASSSKKKRDKADVLSGEGYREELERQVAQKRQELGLLWTKMNELQAKEKELMGKKSIGT
ncbi:hypothetical protein TgHK011_006770 [Trichoderma gracile]|nr:hypothetical protein TgHK011_006770 [Trichoderma gracile]